MNIFKRFFNEIKSFSIKNWWLYIIYVIMLIAIYYLQPDSLMSVVLMSSGHFIADIFIMMMFTAYSQSKFKLGSYFQVISMFLFFLLKLKTAIIEKEWHYLSADIIYALSAYKNYQLDVRKNKINIIRPGTLIILSLIIICGIWLPLKYYSLIPIFEDHWQIVQTIGIFLFGIALSYTGNEQKRYYFSIVSLFIMVFGSTAATISKLLAGKQLTGLEFSYAILPLTVLVFYLGQWKKSLTMQPDPRRNID